MYHRHTKHLTSDWWSLKRLFKRKHNANELRIGRRDICVDPYPAHDHNNGKVNMAECYPFMYEDAIDADNQYYLEEEEEEEEEEDGWAYVVSCHKIIEEFREGPTPTVTPDPNNSVRMLQNSMKFRVFFDGFGFTPAARLEITKAIVNITETSRMTSRRLDKETHLRQKPQPPGRSLRRKRGQDGVLFYDGPPGQQMITKPLAPVEHVRR
ncbi:hypothetical protein RHMOL_Rhmol10G0147100 [Rhododendron molle]|uniref:Uncharacterized protein n=1 Tax=Rhododendron molle TaxID=49168 RepID=A0ACC0M3F9_RHOML|nr:hypothetical protein RHMOL_Rhmol10G0147100 [Rhododendron molle]